jgi:outer membrane protein
LKNASLILNVVLLLAVGVLFWLHFHPAAADASQGHQSAVQKPVAGPATGTCNIGYFEMDSVEASFQMAKEWKNQLEKMEDNMNAQMNNLQTQYQQKFSSLQQRKGTMTNAELEAASNELGALEERIKNTKSNLDQEYKTYYVQKQQEILSMIRKFCSEYNKDGRFAIIVSDEPGLIFYKDSTFDITPDLLAGLNKMYGDQKLQKKK